MANDDRLVSQKRKKETITFILMCENNGQRRNRDENESRLTTRLYEKISSNCQTNARLNFSYVFFSIKFLSISIRKKKRLFKFLTLEKFRSFRFVWNNVKWRIIHDRTIHRSTTIYLSSRTRRKVFVSRKIIVSDRRKPIIVRGIAKFLPEACHRQILAAPRLGSGEIKHLIRPDPREKREVSA